MSLQTRLADFITAVGADIKAINTSLATKYSPSNPPPASGGGLTPTTVKTTAYTAAASELVLANTSTAAFTVTLPAATAGRQVGVKKVDSSINAVTVVGASGSTIDGDASALLYGEDTAITLLADGTNWQVQGSTQQSLAVITGVPMLVAFHIPGTMVAGVRVPKILVTKNLRLSSCQAVVETGTTTTYRIRVKRLAGGTIVTSNTSVGVTTTPVSTSFSPVIDVVPGDTIQVEIVTAGNGVDLSLTVDAVTL